MITASTLYYLVGIAVILCAAAFKLGYEIGKNSQK